MIVCHHALHWLEHEVLGHLLLHRHWHRLCIGILWSLWEESRHELLHKLVFVLTLHKLALTHSHWTLHLIRLYLIVWHLHLLEIAIVLTLLSRYSIGGIVWTKVVDGVGDVHIVSHIVHLVINLEASRY